MEELEKRKAEEIEKLLTALNGQDVGIVPRPQYWPVMPGGPDRVTLLRGRLSRSGLVSSFWSLRLPDGELPFLAGDVAMVFLPSALALQAH